MIENSRKSVERSLEGQEEGKQDGDYDRKETELDKINLAIQKQQQEKAIEEIILTEDQQA